MTKLSNVKGRITYISSHAKQENLYANGSPIYIEVFSFPFIWHKLIFLQSFLRSPAIYGEFLFLKRHIVAVHITGSPIRKAYLIPSVLYFPNYGKRLSTAQMP